MCIISEVVAVEGFVPNFRSDDGRTVLITRSPSSFDHTKSEVRMMVGQAGLVAGRDRAGSQFEHWPRQGRQPAWTLGEARLGRQLVRKGGEEATRSGRETRSAWPSRGAWSRVHAGKAARPGRAACLVARWRVWQGKRELDMAELAGSVAGYGTCARWLPQVGRCARGEGQARGCWARQAGPSRV